MRIASLFFTLLATLLCLSCSAVQAAIVDFEDLTPSVTPQLADGYSGITWNGQWEVSDLNPGFPIASGNNYAFAPTGSGSFSFSQPVQFLGAFFSGIGESFDQDFNPITVTIQYTLSLAGNTVATGSIFSLSDVATFYASGYSGAVDNVEVNFNVPTSYAMDDVEFAPFAPVPEPCTLLVWSVLTAGALGFANRRRLNA